jgi:hypothetical protein
VALLGRRRRRALPHVGDLHAAGPLPVPLGEGPSNRYYRQFDTGPEAYDADKLGWKVVDCPSASCSAQDLPHPRMIYDTSRRGLDNGGHLWGVELSPAQKKDLLEFLKTL